jgi:molybdopterin-binding protein
LAISAANQAKTNQTRIRLPVNKAISINIAARRIVAATAVAYSAAQRI